MTAPCPSCGKAGCPSAADPPTGPMTLHNTAAYAQVQRDQVATGCFACGARMDGLTSEQAGAWMREHRCGDINLQVRLDVALEALRLIADEDYRGNRPMSAVVAENALRMLKDRL